MERTKTHDHIRGPSAQQTPMAAAPELPARTHQPPLSAVMQRAAADPRSLTRANVVQLQRTIGNAAVRQLVAREAPNENRTGLPDPLKAGVENLSGLAMDDVRVHHNSPNSAQLQALAYTQGTDIHVAPGQERHLPHEAWHVVQQKQGRVQPTLQMKGMSINDDGVLEREADAMQHRMAQADSPISLPSVAPAAASSVPTLQRKLRVAGTTTDYSTSQAASAVAPPSVTAVWARLDTAATAASLYTVKTVDAFTALAEDKQADVLLPLKHVIGEQHHLSEFEDIKRDWPKVAAVAEGRHTVRETGLKQKSQAFTEIMQSKSAGDLPLENYHAASLARLISYLVIWNGFQETPKKLNSEHHLLERAGNMTAIYDNYASVAASVFIAGMDASYLGIWPRYANPIEEAYGAMYDLSTKDNSKTALACFKRIEASHGTGSVTAPAISAQEVTAVRVWLKDMVSAVGTILTASAKGHAAEKDITRETKAASAYVTTNYATMSGMNTGLGLINPTRERFMAEEITAAPKPSLIKVGENHLGGLRPLAIADIKLHDDAAAFRADLKKKATDL